MATFGSFETEREVYTDPIYSVYDARMEGDPDGQYAVKLFRLPSSELEVELAKEAGGRAGVERARLNSISVQEAAGKESSSIAPVLERGHDQRGVWYATRFYPRSVNKMMSGKVALPRSSLEHVIRSIVQGAVDFKRVCGRSHGDIRPTNVQVSKTEKLSEAQVVLCDPKPGGIEQSLEYERSDLHAIGLILLQLVRQRLISSEEAAVLIPIAPSPEWTRVFGSDASDWLALCNRLLDPGLDAAQFSLEALLARLEELQPKRGVSRGPAIAAGVCLLLIAVFTFWWLRPRSGFLEVTSDPSGAKIMVDQVKEQGTTPVSFKLKRGNHVIEARLDQLGLEEAATNCVVVSGSTNRLHLRFDYGSISIKSDPPGASVLRDGVIVGQTPSNGQAFVISPLPPGRIKYQLKLDQYQPAEISGTVPKSGQLELAAILRRAEAVKPQAQADIADRTRTTIGNVTAPVKRFVELRSEPVDAVIFDSEGRELGHTSADAPLRLPVAPGAYTFTARANGLDDVVAIVAVFSSGNAQHTFVFDYGTVVWTSNTPGTTVAMKDQTRRTPATFIQRPGVPTSYVISAPGFQTETNVVVVKVGERKTLPVQLLPQLVSVNLVSDPPGADFFGEAGGALPRDPANSYVLPCGQTNLVARHPILGWLTNHVELVASANGSAIPFKFDYGTLILTNLPSDMVVYEGQTKLGSAADGFVYQKPGPHLYALRSRAGTQSVATNINPGLNFLVLVATGKSWKNDCGIYFAWVPNLPGGGSWPGQNGPGGWVGISEVTQGQYKRMNTGNPSIYQDGGDNYPVENVSWEQAMRFCAWLTSSDTTPRLGWRYSLPSSEQFNAFAADADRIPRVTNEGRMSNNLDDGLALQRGVRIAVAPNPNSARSHPESVASTKQANQYGLYDVVGNVWEWLGHAEGKENFYAGGSYLNFSAKTVGSKARERTLEKGPNIGFRVVLLPGD